jgi:hypothetical protein
MIDSSARASRTLAARIANSPTQAPRFRRPTVNLMTILDAPAASPLTCRAERHGRQRAVSGGQVETTMHRCTGCRRALSNSVRNALCLRCLYALDRGSAFNEDAETKPGKRPTSIAPDVLAAAL